MEQSSVLQWEGKVSRNLSKVRADDIWPFFTDFFGLSKWFPGCANSVGLHGNNGELGCIRWATFAPEDGKENRGGEEKWCKERLLVLDDVDKIFSYDIVESNIGFNSYVATFKVVNDDGGGCSIEWCFAVDPIEGMQVQDIEKMFEAELQQAATIMEETSLIPSTSTNNQ